MLRRLYDWTMSLARGRHAPRALAGVSFVESSFFPIPPDLLLIPMCVAEPRKAWLWAGVATVFSVLGGLLGYFIGAMLFEPVAHPILEFYHYADRFEAFQLAFNEWGLLIVFIAGFTPFPYKVITIASGLTGLGLPAFIIASIIARASRFFLVAGLLYFFGEPIRLFIEKRLGLMTAIFGALLVGGFAAIRLFG
ncbi:DedA family protein [Arsenicitalea aurantiaca]|uniref:DedA family protein n=1 Tax=Arsenicitalea aurantiaca TaxID=1783274 RepID=A0A433X5T4_9HYPH|nr:YqaA family protein [Arsenicitalea aurantiaca]RUT29408.1 DedA family protein [Arsenicitalea aurantiaca]